MTGRHQALNLNPSGVVDGGGGGGGGSGGGHLSEGK